MTIITRGMGAIMKGAMKKAGVMKKRPVGMRGGSQKKPKNG